MVNWRLVGADYFLGCGKRWTRPMAWITAASSAVVPPTTVSSAFASVLLGSVDGAASMAWGREATSQRRGGRGRNTTSQRRRWGRRTALQVRG